MIKLKTASKRLVRETKCPFLFVDDNGEERSEDIRVRYYSLTVGEMREFGRRVDEHGSEMYVTDLLMPLLESLPDIVGDDEKPLPITLELLDSFSGVNVKAIHRAIQEDIAGPKKPEKP
jgi:hypothetical protein